MILEKTVHDIDEITAPDFEIERLTGEHLRLANFRHRRHVVLVFNRGFT